LPNGNLLLSNGYDAALWEIDSDAAIVRTLGGKSRPELASLGLYFFGGMQILKNGDIVVSNWTGHGATDSVKGVQLLQFDREGKVVWTWHDPQRAGSIDGVIVLDDLNPRVLNDDISSILGAAGRAGKPL
jgi:hypothetical protein